ncbi:hypothetical protein CDAR_171791 [Caerostris darwini]|uniref:Uncharacterized protein n=1 Tax=Caerostris darwini TaxID=1538125 RepID=A0AAV4MM71_9ARAC|nr:hypothetical protein CDAR_171791 [Caerostris darwini]
MEIQTISCVVCVRRFESAAQWNAPRTSPLRCCHHLPPTDTYSSVRLNTLSGIVLNDKTQEESEIIITTDLLQVQIMCGLAIRWDFCSPREGLSA